METLKTLFEKYEKTSSESNMRDFLCVLSSFVEDMRNHHPKEVEDMLEASEEALSPFLTHQEAEDIVAGFVNKDGTKGQHWTLEQTKEAAAKHAVDLEGSYFRCYDWFALLNMIYSDNYSPNWPVDTYVELAKNFVMDEDFDKPGKVKWYFKEKHRYLTK